jgi:hypothetical protein
MNTTENGCTETLIMPNTRDLLRMRGAGSADIVAGTWFDRSLREG